MAKLSANGGGDGKDGAGTTAIEKDGATIAWEGEETIQWDVWYCYDQQHPRIGGQQ